jgi:hypothetical protein
MFIINISIDVIIIILLIIFSKIEMNKRLSFSLLFLGFGIFCSMSLSLLFYIIYQFNELMFQIFSIFFLICSFLGIIIIFINLLKDEPIILSIIIPFINIFLLCLYLRIYVWKIDRNKYIENKKQNKINKDNKKITI